MAGFLKRFPGFALFTTLTILTVLAQIPCLLVYYLPTSPRPVKIWTLHEALGRETLKLWFWYTAAFGFQIPFNLDAGKEKERFVATETDQSPDIYQDALLANTNITPVTIGAVCNASLIMEGYVL